MKTVKLFYTALLILVATTIFAAPSPPPSATSGPSCWPPPCVPIDNGMIFLIVAGALFGAKKLYDFRKKSEAVS